MTPLAESPDGLELAALAHTAPDGFHRFGSLAFANQAAISADGEAG